MRTFRTRAFALLLLICGGIAIGSSRLATPPRAEKVIFVEPPLRFITQCELRELKEGALTCTRDGFPTQVSLTPDITVWKGKDNAGTSTLQLGDRLDIKMGLDSHSREVATFIWANFVKVEGVVGIRGSRRWLRLQPLVPFSLGEVSDEPVWVHVDGETTFIGGAPETGLRQGRPVIVIGQRWGNRRVQASRIVLAPE